MSELYASGASWGQPTHGGTYRRVASDVTENDFHRLRDPLFQARVKEHVYSCQSIDIRVRRVEQNPLASDLLKLLSRIIFAA